MISSLVFLDLLMVSDFGQLFNEKPYTRLIHGSLYIRKYTTNYPMKPGQLVSWFYKKKFYTLKKETRRKKNENTFTYTPDNYLVNWQVLKPRKT